MSRKNIFEILTDKKINIVKETEKIAKLLETIHIVHFHIFSNREEQNFTILEFLREEKIFINWKYRKTYFSIKEMIKDMNIDILNYDEISTEQIILYLEFSINMIRLFNKFYKKYKNSGYYYDKDLFNILCENISYLLENLNLKIVEKDSDIYIG